MSAVAVDPKKLIWTIGRKLELSEDEIRAVLVRETSKESMRACSDQELQRVVLALRKLQGEANHTGDRATKRQLWFLRQLETSLGWQDEPYRLQAYLLKYYKVERIEWLTREQAWRATESLKKVLARQK
ncbi:regulatory protein GemA [Mycobacterium gordonae]|nr:regulatory protein GemA [Mycobacterium gordonae]